MPKIIIKKSKPTPPNTRSNTTITSEMGDTLIEDNIASSSTPKKSTSKTKTQEIPDMCDSRSPEKSSQAGKPVSDWAQEIDNYSYLYDKITENTTEPTKYSDEDKTLDYAEVNKKTMQILQETLTPTTEETRPSSEEVNAEAENEALSLHADDDMEMDDFEKFYEDGYELKEEDYIKINDFLYEEGQRFKIKEKRNLKILENYAKTDQCEFSYEKLVKGAENEVMNDGWRYVTPDRIKEGIEMCKKEREDRRKAAEKALNQSKQDDIEKFELLRKFCKKEADVEKYLALIETLRINRFYLRLKCMTDMKFLKKYRSGEDQKEFESIKKERHLAKVKRHNKNRAAKPGHKEKKRLKRKEKRKEKRSAAQQPSAGMQANGASSSRSGNKEDARDIIEGRRIRLAK